MTNGARGILVVKLGALGDFIQALGPFAAIRRHHAGDRIVLLTTAPFADLARQSTLFDEVWLDDRPGALNPSGWLALRRRLRAGHFARVYDLQTSDRSSFYFRLFWPGPYPEWSGIARGCSHPHANAARDFMHTLERQAEQLRMAGIAEARAQAPDVSFVAADVARFDLKAPYALLVPGGASHRPAKRWPVERFAALATELAGRGMVPVVLGVAAEGALGARIRELCSAVRDLTGRTALTDIAVLARGARCAVGNDTGPMHLIAAAKCPVAVLFSGASDPALCAPRGEKVAILRREPLGALDAGEALAALKGLGVL